MSKSKAAPDVEPDETEESPARLEEISSEGHHVDAADAVLERGANYGMYFNIMRALPDIRDGLKNVQRRIIFGMHDQGLHNHKSFRKCANAVGHVMGTLHPHGDSAIYEALVLMAQPFSFNVPLIHGQGNFGSIDDDPHAAMRYTEAKLSRAASDWTGDLKPTVVEYKPTFDERGTEPTVLPVTFPNLLVNGASGIGWALAVSVPPHNLGEAVDAAILLAEKPEANLKQVLRRMPGPDYPTRGILVNPDALAEAYASGTGSFLLQARYHVENLSGGQQAVVVTELPYKVGPSRVCEEIIGAAKSEKITEITEKPVNQTNKHGIKIVIKCKRGGNVQALIAQLLRYTSLRSTQKINFTVLVDGQPRTVGLMELLQTFVAFRHQVIRARLEDERRGHLERLHMLAAERAALDVIDRVIKIIRSSKDDDSSKLELKKVIKVRPWGAKKLVPIDDEQATHIINLRLRKLNSLNQLELDEEIERRTLRVQEIDAILADAAAVTAIVVEELRAVRKAYAGERRTALSEEGAAAEGGGAAGGSEPLTVSLPRTDVQIWASAAGQAISLEADKNFKTCPLQLAGSDHLATQLLTHTEAELHAFTAAGLCYRVRAADLGVDSKRGKGRALCGMPRGDRLVALLPADQQDFLVLITRGGQVKRMDQATLSGSHSGGLEAFGLAAGDELLRVLPCSSGEELLVHSAAGKALRTPLDAIATKKTPGAGGMALMRLAGEDQLVGAVVVPAAGAEQGQRLLVLHRGGSAKAVDLAEYPTKGRGGGGVASADPAKPSRQPAGPISAVALIPPQGKLRLVSAGGQLLEQEASSAPTAARAAVSRPWLELNEDDQPSQLLLTP